MINPVAIRSLQCADHAYHIPPKVLSVSWMIGKRCNFDCSYCSPHVHDAVSPFLDLASAKKFIDAVEIYSQNKDKKIKWAFTGGEPFLDPGLLTLCQYIQSNSSTEQIDTITNGSLPLDFYLRAAELVHGITVSLHLERSDLEIQNIIDKCAIIKQHCFCSINLMFLPGRASQVQQIMQRLEQLSLPFVLRKITPQKVEDKALPYKQHGTGKKNIQLLDVTQQSEAKITWKQQNISSRTNNLKEWYSAVEDLELLQQINAKTPWQNCGIWTENGNYSEINTDQLLSNDLVNFRDWICFAGVDSLYVHFDGQIYRASCFNSGALAHISDGVSFCDSPVVCEKDACVCNQDIATRKARSNFLRHVQF